MPLTLFHYPRAALTSGAAHPEEKALPIYGRMFWFSRKKFVGSYLRLSARSRSYLASP